MSENLNNNNASDVESVTDIAQFIALLNPIIPTREKGVWIKTLF